MAQSSDDCVGPRYVAKRANVNPQMIYNYIRQGRIPAYECKTHERKCIKREDMNIWLDARQAKVDAKQAKINEQLLEGYYKRGIM